VRRFIFGQSYDFFRRIEHFQNALTHVNACIITDDALKHNNLPSLQTKMNRPQYVNIFVQVILAKLLTYNPEILILTFFTVEMQEFAEKYMIRKEDNGDN
jgi:hypothetical protein